MANLTQLTLVKTLDEVLQKLPSSPNKPALEGAARAIFALLEDYPRRARLVDLNESLSHLGKSQALEALREAFKRQASEAMDRYRLTRNTYMTALEAAEEYLPQLDETVAAALHFGAQDFKIPVPDLKRLRVGVGG